MRTVTSTTIVLLLSSVIVGCAEGSYDDAKERVKVSALIGSRESIRDDSHTMRPPGIDVIGGDSSDSDNDEEDVATGARTDVDGRQNNDPNDCGYVDPNVHHQLPCEDDVDSPVMETPAPIGGRDDMTARPTAVPTSAPSATATAAPSAFAVTASPSDGSISLTSSPTTIDENTSRNPTDDTSTTTSAPTTIDQYSQYPSDSPSMSPSGTPTMVPNPSNPTNNAPSSSPVDDSNGTVCKSGEGGTFGKVDTEPEILVRVSYLYEMEVVPGTAESDIEDIILPSLERSFIDSILPVVFPEECNTMGRRLNMIRRRLKVIGISANPPDEVIPDGTYQ
jgi:hypothetical protein